MELSEDIDALPTLEALEEPDLDTVSDDDILDPDAGLEAGVDEIAPDSLSGRSI